MKKPGKTRSKAIKTIAQQSGLTEEQAKQKQAIAIALSKAKVAKK